MNVCQCPSEPLLKDYLSGRLDRATHDVIDDHLDACPACQSTADGLESELDLSFPGLRPTEGADSRP